jgi:hypothetical protein
MAGERRSTNEGAWTPQFTLRGLLAMTAVAAVLLGCWRWATPGATLLITAQLSVWFLAWHRQSLAAALAVVLIGGFGVLYIAILLIVARMLTG